MKYSDKLKSPKWQRKRLEVLQRDDFKCRLCGNTEIELQIHHLKYSGEPHEAPLENLITYCKVCHQVVEQHKGENVTNCVLNNVNGEYDIYVYKIEPHVYMFSKCGDEIYARCYFKKGGVIDIIKQLLDNGNG